MCVCPAAGFEGKPREGKIAGLTSLLRMFFPTLRKKKKGKKKVCLLAGSDTDEGMWLVHRLQGCTGDPSPLQPGRRQGYRAEDTRHSLIQEPSNGSCSIAGYIYSALLWGSSLSSHWVNDVCVGVWLTRALARYGEPRLPVFTQGGIMESLGTPGGKSCLPSSKHDEKHPHREWHKPAP